MKTENLLSITSEYPSFAKPKISFHQEVFTLLNETNQKLGIADKALEELAKGHQENLHQTMIKLAEARLSFQFLDTIRKRLIEAYQTLLREPI